VRDYLNMPRDPHPDANRIWMPINTAPIGQAKPAKPAPAPGGSGSENASSNGHGVLVGS